MSDLDSVSDGNGFEAVHKSSSARCKCCLCINKAIGTELTLINKWHIHTGSALILSAVLSKS